jgi:taurine--2-oxoglutarate transaminase
MILDEVMAGFGRTGDWFAFDAFNVTPDLITFAKGVNSGYVPVGGVIISGEIASTFDERVFPGGLTYSGHPIAAASIVASIEAFEEEDIIGNAARIGRDHLEPGLQALAEKHSVIGEVRGRGVFWALELVQDRATRNACHRRIHGSAEERNPASQPAAVHLRQPRPRRAAGRYHRRRSRRQSHT